MHQQAFFWKGSLLPLLLLSALLLCSNVTSHLPCHNGVDNCPKTLQEFFNVAEIQSYNINEFASQLFAELHKVYSTAPWYFADNIRPCHTESIKVPKSDEEAKKMSSLELFSLSRFILRSWMDPLNYVSWQIQGASYGEDTLLQLKLQTEQLLEEMDDIADKVDPSIKENRDYVPWLELPALQMSTDSNAVRPSFYVSRCMMKDAQNVLSYMRILQCQYSYAGHCEPNAQ